MTTKRGWDSNFPTTGHSVPLNLLILTVGPSGDRVLFSRNHRYPRVVTTLPPSREDDYTDKCSAHSILRRPFLFVYTSFPHVPFAIAHIELRQVFGQIRALLGFTRTFRPNFHFQHTK